MDRTFRIPLVLLAVALIAVPCGFCAEPKDVRTLVKALQSGDRQSRRWVMRDLQDFGLDAAPATPDLVRALEDPDKYTRIEAARAVEAIGKEASAAIPKLIALLGEDEPPRISTELVFADMGLTAALALGKMGEEAVGPLVRCLEHRSWVVRYNASYALGEIGIDAKSATAALIRRFDDKDWMVRSSAAWAVRKIRPDAKTAVPALARLLRDENVSARVAAVDALAAIRPVTSGAIEGLIRALLDKNGEVQARAATALGSLGPEGAPAILALCETLESREGYPVGHPAQWHPVAETAARALGQIGPKAKDAMPGLLDIIRNTRGTYDGVFGLPEENSAVRQEAMSAAVRIDSGSDRLLTALRESVEQNSRLREAAAVALAGIGAKAKTAVPALVEGMKGDDANRLTFACAVLRIEPGNPEARKALLEELNADRDLQVDSWDLLSDALKQSGPDCRRAVPMLIRLLDPESGDPENAVRALGQLGPDAQSAVPALMKLLDEVDDDLRREAIIAVQRITLGKSSLLKAAWKDRSPGVRTGVVEVLGGSPSNVAVLTEALSDPSARVRLAAVTALGKLGESAKPAIPQVKRLLQDDLRTIREAAQNTLNRWENGKAPKP